MKDCGKCGDTLPLDAFYSDRGKRDGRHTICKECAKADRRARYAADPETIKARNRESMRRHPDTQRAVNLRRYGLTLEQYDEMLRDQDGLCAACGLPETSSNQFGPCSLSVDHCHTTGAVRGLLCRACNRALGLLNDDPAKIRGLLAYAERTSEHVCWL